MNKTTSSFDEKVKVETADLLLSSTGQYSRWQSLRQNNDRAAARLADVLLQRHLLLMANNHGEKVDWRRFDTFTQTLSQAGIHLYDSRYFLDQSESRLVPTETNGRQKTDDSFVELEQSLPLPQAPPGAANVPATITAFVEPQHTLSTQIKAQPGTPVVHTPQSTNSPASAAQVSASPSLLNDEYSLIFNVICRPIGLQMTSFGYGDENITLLPLGEIATALDLKIDIDPAAAKATGWFISEDRTFSLDINKQELRIAGDTVPWQKNAAFVYDNEIYVDSRAFSSWLPLDFDISRSELSVSITPREKLPLQAKMEREERRLRLRSNSVEALQYPVRALEYDLFSIPVMDVSMSGGFDQKEFKSSDTKSSYSLLGRGDLFYMSSEYFVSGYEDDPLNTARIRLERVAPAADLLGPLQATQMSLGDILPASFAILDRPSPERGITFSNADLVRTSDFDLTTFEGNVLPGWEVELHYNGTLLDSALVGADGRYYFEDVPLFYGNNDFQVIAYGPQGQKEIIDDQAIPVGSEMLPSGEYQYDLSLSQREKTIWGIDEKGRPPEDNSARFRGNYKYGLTDSLSVALGLASVEFNKERHNYLQAGFSGSTSFLYGQVDYLYDTASGSGLSALAQTSVGSVDIKAKHEWFSDFVMENRPNSVLESKSELTIQGMLPETKLSSPISYGLSYENTNYSDYITSKIGARLSSRMAGVHVTNNTYWNYNDTRPGEGNLIDGNLNVSGNAGPVRILAGMQYDLGEKNKITRYSLSSHWQMNNTLSGGFDLIHDDDLYQRTTATARLDWDAGFATFSPHLSYDSDNNVSVAATMSFSLGPDPVSPSWAIAMSSERKANSGAAKALVYHDANNNQVFDEGDTQLPEVDVLATQARKSAATGESGHAAITGLTAYSPTDIKVDVDTLEDPFWQPSLAGTAILPRPGHVDYVEFPVVSTGEVDGTVYSTDGQGVMKNLAFVQLELLDSEGNIVQSIRSEYDGFYLFEKVFPGDYTLRVSPDDPQGSVLAGGQELKVTIGNDGTIASGMDIRLQGPDGNNRQNVAPVGSGRGENISAIEPVKPSSTVENPRAIADILEPEPMPTFVAESLVKERMDIVPEISSSLGQAQEIAATDTIQNLERVYGLVTGPTARRLNEPSGKLIQEGASLVQSTQRKDTGGSRFEAIPLPIAQFRPIGEVVTLAAVNRNAQNKSLKVYQDTSDSFPDGKLQKLRGVV
ncbi:MAG: hypothetical protein JKY62_07915 [Desulfocapsa sp.]|uniref:Copper amine oxidase-like N-terminal domain-containing protein n=1 Tax=Desulfotalea psychrophila TaxID=84980 RepID=A0ABS3AVA3_9BACT|nr:hypothetical protein [Desulfocapsa sp.]MBN4068577.1 hypothetical protein [Desulfotalea psychrophila]